MTPTPPTKGTMMKSWKTTLAGVLTIVGALCTAGIAALKGQMEVAIGALTVGIPSGIGLMKSRDDDKSSEDVGTK